MAIPFAAAAASGAAQQASPKPSSQQPPPRPRAQLQADQKLVQQYNEISEWAAGLNPEGETQGIPNELIQESAENSQRQLRNSQHAAYPGGTTLYEESPIIDADTMRGLKGLAGLGDGVEKEQQVTSAMTAAMSGESTPQTEGWLLGPSGLPNDPCDDKAYKEFKNNWHGGPQTAVSEVEKLFKEVAAGGSTFMVVGSIAEFIALALAFPALFRRDQSFILRGLAGSGVAVVVAFMGALAGSTTQVGIAHYEGAHESNHELDRECRAQSQLSLDPNRAYVVPKPNAAETTPPPASVPPQQ